MGDMNQLAGGMDTIRLSAEEQTALARKRTRAKARGNLAAILVDRAGGLERLAGDDVAAMVAAEFAELCEALGLEQPPDYAPGVCHRSGCSGEIPAGNAVRPHDHQRKGFCSVRCQRMANLDNVEGVS